MKRFLLASALSLCAFAARADDLGVTAQAVYDRVQQNESKLLFVDVRDPVEIMFVGFTDAVHVNVPYLLVDRNTWDEQRGTYKVSQNLTRRSCAVSAAHAIPRPANRVTASVRIRATCYTLAGSTITPASWPARAAISRPSLVAVCQRRWLGTGRLPAR